MIFVGYGGIGFGGIRKVFFDLVFFLILFGKVGYVGRFDVSCSSGYGGGFFNFLVSGMF